MTDPEWIEILKKARSGNVLHPPIGRLGSAGWQPESPIPETLILCDLLIPDGKVASSPIKLPWELPPFPISAFQHVLELDLSGNALLKIPNNICTSLPNLHCLFLGGYPEDKPEYKNRVTFLPSLAKLTKLEHLSVHDTDLKCLPELPESLTIMRIDRCPIQVLPTWLPLKMSTLHLEGCPLPGTLDRPDLLPEAVKALTELDDLQLPDGSHVGTFFGTPLPHFLLQSEEKAD